MAELSENADLREIVRERYAAAADRIAEGTTSGCACGPSETTASCCSADADLRTTDADGVEVFGAALYGDESAGASTAAVEASLGCGVPTAIADLHAGETVLDLGSGAGADVLISARRVGPTGRAIGLDMTDEMLALAQVGDGGRDAAAERRVDRRGGGVARLVAVEGGAEDVDAVSVGGAQIGVDGAAGGDRVGRAAGTTAGRAFGDAVGRGRVAFADDLAEVVVAQLSHAVSSSRASGRT